MIVKEIDPYALGCSLCHVSKGPWQGWVPAVYRGNSPIHQAFSAFLPSLSHFFTPTTYFLGSPANKYLSTLKWESSRSGERETDVPALSSGRRRPFSLSLFCSHQTFSWWEEVHPHWAGWGGEVCFAQSPDTNAKLIQKVPADTPRIPLTPWPGHVNTYNGPSHLPSRGC